MPGKRFEGVPDFHTDAVPETSWARDEALLRERIVDRILADLDAARAGRSGR